MTTLDEQLDAFAANPPDRKLRELVETLVQQASQLAGVVQSADFGDGTNQAIIDAVIETNRYLVKMLGVTIPRLDKCEIDSRGSIDMIGFYSAFTEIVSVDLECGECGQAPSYCECGQVYDDDLEEYVDTDEHMCGVDCDVTPSEASLEDNYFDAHGPGYYAVDDGGRYYRPW